MQAYRIRAKSLREMGFPTNMHYLRSNLWKRIRRNILYRDKLCRVCDTAKSTQVHHLSYDIATMRGRDRKNLIGICGGCHKFIELRDGEKVTLEKANDRGGLKPPGGVVLMQTKKCAGDCGEDFPIRTRFRKNRCADCYRLHRVRAGHKRDDDGMKRMKRTVRRILAETICPACERPVAEVVSAKSRSCAKCVKIGHAIVRKVARSADGFRRAMSGES